MADTTTLDLEMLNSLLGKSKEKGERKERTVLHPRPIAVAFVESGEMFKVVQTSWFETNEDGEPQLVTVDQIVKSFENALTATEFNPETREHDPRIKGGENIAVRVKDGNILLINSALVLAAQENNGASS